MHKQKELVNSENIKDSTCNLWFPKIFYCLDVITRNIFVHLLLHTESKQMQMSNTYIFFFNLYIPVILNQKSQENSGLCENMKRDSEFKNNSAKVFFNIDHWWACLCEPLRRNKNLEMECWKKNRYICCFPFCLSLTAFLRHPFDFFFC